MTTNLDFEPVPPASLDRALAHIEEGGRLIVPTYTRTTVIDQKTVTRFAKAGTWLLKEEGDGYRLRSGKGSVYVLPGQLKYA